MSGLTYLKRHGLYVPGADPDSLLHPSLDLITAGEPIVRFRSVQDREFRKVLQKRWWKAEEGAISLPTGNFRLQHHLAMDLPQFFGAVSPTPVAVTPTTLGSTTARVFPFATDSAEYILKVYIHTPSAVASSMQLACFESLGHRAYNSGTQGTSANITSISTTNWFLPGGAIMFWAITNANLTSSTTAYYFSPAFAAATLARWGTVAATSGAMPSTITPSGITATVGGFACYTVLGTA